MAPHSSTLAWKIPWMEEPGRLQSMGATERLHFHFSLSCIGEGNDNPLQCSCLENPRDGGAWWAAIYGVAQSRTRLKRLSSSSSSRDLFKKIRDTKGQLCMCICMYVNIYAAVAPAAKSLQSCPTLCDPIDGRSLAPPSLGFSRQEHWSGLPFPSPMHESEK